MARLRRTVVRLAPVICAWLVGCAGEPPAPWRGSGTARMAERLQQLAAEADPQLTTYGGSSARLEAARAAGPPADPRRQLVFKASVARETLHAGRIDEAIARFEELAGDIERQGDRVPASLTLAILESLATAYLKLWEQENCVLGPSRRSCFLPIDMEGEARNVRAARSALAVCEWLLENDPDNLTTRWLLNLAYMMLGEYPQEVPPRYLIPLEAFRSAHDVGVFADIAGELGLDVMGHAGGSILDDFDGDGDLDIVASSWHLTDQLHLFRNDGNGKFTDRTSESGLEGIVGGLNMVQADYNNDGHLDIFVLRGAWLPYGQPNSLLRNNGDGTFEDVTFQAGLGDEHSTQTASWGDYDNDGWVDLYIGNESAEGEMSGSGSERAPADRTRRSSNQLFRNNGDGTFTDVAAQAGAAVTGFVKAVVWGDVDNDGRLDLFISRLRQPNVLLHNDGPDAAGNVRFSDVTDKAGVAEPHASFPTWFWDYDNDGWLDIFVMGYSAEPGDMAAEYLGLGHRAETPRLYRNAGDGTFSDVTTQVRLDKILFAMGANFGDLDNDGYPDFYVGTGDSRFRLMVPNRMFRSANADFFQDVTTSGGFGHLGKGHAVAFGDLDNDGDQDIYATMGGAYEGDLALNLLFENPGHGNNWITLRLEGVRSNRVAIGARIKVSVQTESGLREIHASVTSGGSFGANSLQQEIGLGQATAIRTVEITWPSTGTTDTFTDTEMNRAYRVREGDASLTASAMSAFRLAPDRPARSH